MTEGNLTHRDLARMLGVSETTVKSYRRKFPDCIPVASQGKPIRFTAEAAAVALRIRDLFEMGMSVEEVRARLVADFAWIPAPAPADTDAAGTAVPAPPARVELPQDFTLAVSTLAKSMVGLTQQQGVILKRMQHIEGMIDALSHAGGKAMGTVDAAGGADVADRPAWLDEAQALAARFEALLRAVPASAGQTSAETPPGQPAPHATLSDVAGRTAASAPGGAPDAGPIPPHSAPAAAPEGRGALFPGGLTAPTPDRANAPEPTLPASQDPPRHLLALPLVVQSPQGEFLGVAGKTRGRFCINDLKAMLAFAFQPPDHYALRSRPAGDDGWWLVLEQPQAAEPCAVMLLVGASVTPRGNQVAVVRRYAVNGVESHPTDICGFLKTVQG